MSWITYFLNLYDWYTHLLRTSPTRNIHLYVLDNSITSNPNNIHHYSKESMLADSFDLTSKLSVQRAMLLLSAHMETEAIIEYWFEEEA
ncbi:hypothetical protein AHAS_Ahas03G0150100 [Arachis hypogaea]